MNKILFVLIVLIVETMAEIITVAVIYEGHKSGNTVRLNCSVSITPPSKTIEFLVDSITTNNIRLYNGECYLTHKGIPCNSSECQCSENGRRYFWVYETIKSNFTTTCKTKISELCSVNATIHLTDTEVTPYQHSVRTCATDGTMGCSKGKAEILLYCVLIWMITKSLGSNCEGDCHIHEKARYCDMSLIIASCQ